MIEHANVCIRNCVVRFIANDCAEIRWVKMSDTTGAFSPDCLDPSDHNSVPLPGFVVSHLHANSHSRVALPELCQRLVG
jgi:hypothetical protein